jgi:hypothetical protein
MRLQGMHVKRYLCAMESGGQWRRLLSASMYALTRIAAYV